MPDPTPAELAELDQARAGAEEELDRTLAALREVFAAEGEDVATLAVVEMVARATVSAARGGLVLCLVRLAKQGRP